jgi:hypothetical protein
MKLGHLPDELDVAGLEATVDVDVSLAGAQEELVGGGRHLRLLLRAFIFIHRYYY